MHTDCAFHSTSLKLSDTVQQRWAGTFLEALSRRFFWTPHSLWSYSRYISLIVISLPGLFPFQNTRKEGLSEWREGGGISTHLSQLSLFPTLLPSGQTIMWEVLNAFFQTHCSLSEFLIVLHYSLIYEEYTVLYVCTVSESG